MSELHPLVDVDHRSAPLARFYAEEVDPGFGLRCRCAGQQSAHRKRAGRALALVVVGRPGPP
jgi:hypothetical protein